MRPPPPLALTALLLGCAARLPAPALALPDLHAHDQPIVLSQRVAIDEAPCEGAALTPLGGLGPVATDQYIALGPGETGLAPLRCFAPVNERRARAATSCASGRWRWIGRCAGSTERSTSRARWTTRGRRARGRRWSTSTPRRRCDGASGACPADAFRPSTAVCRAAAGGCDLAERCTGAAAPCPDDARKATGAAARTPGSPAAGELAPPLRVPSSR